MGFLQLFLLSATFTCNFTQLTGHSDVSHSRKKHPRCIIVVLYSKHETRALFRQHSCDVQRLFSFRTSMQDNTAGSHVNQTHHQPISVLFTTVDGLLTSNVKFMQMIPVKALKTSVIISHLDHHSFIPSRPQQVLLCVALAVATQQCGLPCVHAWILSRSLSLRLWVLKCSISDVLIGLQNILYFFFFFNGMRNCIFFLPECNGVWATFHGWLSGMRERDFTFNTESSTHGAKRTLITGQR